MHFYYSNIIPAIRKGESSKKRLNVNEHCYSSKSVSFQHFSEVIVSNPSLTCYRLVHLTSCYKPHIAEDCYLSCLLTVVASNRGRTLLFLFIRVGICSPCSIPSTLDGSLLFRCIITIIVACDLGFAPGAATIKMIPKATTLVLLQCVVLCLTPPLFTSKYHVSVHEGQDLMRGVQRKESIQRHEKKSDDRRPLGGDRL